ncbi:MAG: dihydrofolate reductase family protein, partial [Oceanococcaceae bacterium]
TQVGVMTASAQQINPGFHRRMRGGRPWVRLKMASTQDGRTALTDGRSQWITGPAARRDGHVWRARSCAIVTGSGTVLADDPQMTVRYLREIPRQPLRVVVDRRSQLAEKRWQIFDDAAETLWLHGERWSPLAVLDQLARLDCNEVLLEAGPTLSAAWLDAGLVDELILYQNASLLGSGRNLLDLPEPEALDSRLCLDVIERRYFGADCRIMARPLIRNA